MIYFDNAATTPLSLIIKKILVQVHEDNFANPSSTHCEGKKAQKMLEQSRDRIARLFNRESRDFFFTSGATESANIIILGYSEFLTRTRSIKNEIIISPVEHPAVENAVMSLQRKGFIIRKLKVDANGLIDKADLIAQINENTALVACIHTNNEIASVQDIRELSRLCKEKNKDILFLCDIVQAVGKVNVSLTEDVDAFFVSGHKIGTPKGMGFFYLNHKFRIFPVIFGGGQESGYRSGTTSPQNAFLLAEALSDVIGNFDANFKHVTRLGDLLIDILTKNNIRYKRNIDSQYASPYILSLSITDSTGEFLLQELSSRGICISQGSACSSAGHSKSRILEAIGLSDQEMDSTVRISFSVENTEAEVIEFVKNISEIIQNKVSLRRR